MVALQKGALFARYLSPVPSVLLGIPIVVVPQLKLPGVTAFPLVVLHIRKSLNLNAPLLPKLSDAAPLHPMPIPVNRCSRSTLGPLPTKLDMSTTF